MNGVVMKQLSIISENRIGVVTEITEALAAADVNIESIDAETIGEHVVVVLNVNKYDAALQAVHQLKNMHIITEDAILVKLNDEPGALARIARRFTDAGIELRSIRFMERNSDYSLVAISTDRTANALALVADVLVSQEKP
ncbi:MAG: ACT domain-containing protein, partial [Methylobacter sp.]